MKKTTVIMICLWLLLLGIEFAYADINNGLIAYYPFTGNADDTIGDNNGTVYNATLTTDRFGHPNSAYYFNGISSLSGGGSYIQLAHNFDFLSMGEVTFSVWVKPVGNGDSLIFHQGNGGLLFMGMSGRDARFGCRLDDNTWFEATAPVLTENTWVNLTGVYYARNKVELWINGNLAATTDLAAFNLQNPNWGDTFYAGIGAYRESWYLDKLPAPFTGTIDDFRIYNRALPAADIKQLTAFGNPITGSISLLLD